LFNLAIGKPGETVDFIISKNSNSHLQGTYIDSKKDYLIIREKIDDKISLRCCSLDELYCNKKLRSPNLIKIDIEGAEKDALKYVANIAEKISPIIILELHNEECFRTAWDFSNDSNYLLYNLFSEKIVENIDEVNEMLLCFHRDSIKSLTNKVSKLNLNI